MPNEEAMAAWVDDGAGGCRRVAVVRLLAFAERVAKAPDKAAVDREVAWLEDRVATDLEALRRISNAERRSRWGD